MAVKMFGCSEGCHVDKKKVFLGRAETMAKSFLHELLGLIIIFLGGGSVGGLKIVLRLNEGRLRLQHLVNCESLQTSALRLLAPHWVLPSYL